MQETRLTFVEAMRIIQQQPEYYARRTSWQRDDYLTIGDPFSDNTLHDKDLIKMSHCEITNEDFYGGYTPTIDDVLATDWCVIRMYERRI